MVQFVYNRKLEMTPRPGVRYATTYIKQSATEHARLRTWLVQVAESILDICNHDPQVAEWFTRPMPDFKKSTRRDYYTPEELLTDMILQLSQGRDITEAMTGRWNRLTQGTPWQIDFAKQE